MQVIAIVGYKNSGKTTLITRLIPALGQLGLSVSTIKHVHHTIDLDQPGKDTYAHREAGAVDVMMFSDKRWALLHERRENADTRPDLDDLLRRLSPVDVVLIEGFKSIPIPRIEIRKPDDPSPIVPGAEGLLAIVTDGAVVAEGVSVFRRDDIGAVATFIAQVIKR